MGVPQSPDSQDVCMRIPSKFCKSYGLACHATNITTIDFKVCTSTENSLTTKPKYYSELLGICSLPIKQTVDEEQCFSYSNFARSTTYRTLKTLEVRTAVIFMIRVTAF